MFQLEKIKITKANSRRRKTIEWLIKNYMPFFDKFGMREENIRKISVGLGLSLTALILGIESYPYLFVAGVILPMIAIGVWFDVKQRSE